MSTTKYYKAEFRPEIFVPAVTLKSISAHLTVERFIPVVSEDKSGLVSNDAFLWSKSKQRFVGN